MDPHSPEAARHLPATGVAFSGRALGWEEGPRLEGRLYVPLDGALHPGVVLCHANPAAGGSMEMKIMIAIEAALANSGMATLRYNSRGVGGSEGSISRAADHKLVGPEGTGETEDVGAALDFLAMQEGVNQSKLALVGHSFGSRISLAYLASHPEDKRVKAVVCIGLPVAWRHLGHLGHWPGHKLFVTGEHDDFSPPDKLAVFVATLTQPSTLVTLHDTGHFFEGREAELGATVSDFLQPVLA